MKRLARLTLVVLFFTTLIGSPTAAQENAAAGLPLLPAGQHIGIVYSGPTYDAGETLGNAFGEALMAGATGYEISIHWSDLEPSPGQYDLSLLEENLAIIRSLDMVPYVVIRSIDTNVLSMPSDLADGNELLEGRHFDDPLIIERYHALMDQVVPLVVQSNGFFIAVGNEVDIWLSFHEDEWEPYVNFVVATRQHIQSIEPQMGVGANITFEGVVDNEPFVQDILAVSDAASYSYYPMRSNFTPFDPSAVSEHIAMFVETAGDLPILFQEIGYPSGYLPDPNNQSSVEMQAGFVTEMFAAIEAHPQIRFVSFQHLGDWEDEVCDFFLDYYGSHAAPFREFLCTLGYYTSHGEKKPAFDAFMAGLAGLD
jgi:hypothetical protein